MCRKLIFLVSLVLVLGSVWTNSTEAADPGLLGWWTFDEGSGAVAADSSGRDMHGALGDNPVWRDDGVHNGCLFFDGDLAHVRIPHHDSLNPGDGNFTFAFWANMELARGANGSTVWDLAVNKRDVGSQGFYIGANRDQGNADQAGYKFMLGDTSGARVDTPYLVVSLGEWVHVTAVVDRDQNVHKISVDGGQTWEGPVQAGYLPDDRVSGGDPVLDFDKEAIDEMGYATLEQDRSHILNLKPSDYIHEFMVAHTAT